MKRGQTALPNQTKSEASFESASGGLNLVRLSQEDSGQRGINSTVWN